MEHGAKTRNVSAGTRLVLGLCGIAALGVVLFLYGAARLIMWAFVDEES